MKGKTERWREDGLFMKSDGGKNIRRTTLTWR